ncbi:MAG: hypothetical protein WC529_04090 [Candidatus Margulisiibacteriota bacterium]
MSGPINKTGSGPQYYKVAMLEHNRRIRIDDVRIPRGTSILVARGWDRTLREGLKIDQLKLQGHDRMMGMVFRYAADGQELAGQAIVELGHYKVLDRARHIEAVVEIVPSDKAGKLTVIERRLDTTGLSEDRSKYVYTLTDSAAKLIEAEVIDLAWIKDIALDQHGVTVKFVTPGVEASTERTVRLPAAAFRDNAGKPLFGNPEARVAGAGDVYQSRFYTTETERFRPELDYFNGNLRLIVHKVDRYEIDLPAGLQIAAGETVKIFPSGVDAVATVAGREVPLTVGEPLTKQLQEMIDPNLSQVQEGQIKSAIGPQTRFGESDNLSSNYPRDPYFYGLMIFALHRSVEKWGENFAINRAKAVRAFRGIQSGRTHVMPWELLYKEFADVFEANGDHLRKLSNFAEEIWGPGVSEDTQMEMAYWLKGIKMWVVKEMVALMSAEKEWGRYDIQNTKRYDYSEVLFNLSALLAKTDIVQGRFLGRKPVLMKWAEMSEITAGRTWYKMPFAKLTELAAIPTYLLSFGHVLWYPVDLAYFVGAWLFRTVASSVNYTRHLLSLGYGFKTGFWKNPAEELTMLRGYYKAAMDQFLRRYQYGTFVPTVSGSGAAIPDDYKALIRRNAWATGVSAVVTGVMLGLGGLASWLALPLGIAAIPLGLSLYAKGFNAFRGWKRGLVAAGGAATAAAGLGLAIFGAPVLWATPLSLALIANIGFGLYSLGLLVKAQSAMKKATREDELIKAGNRHQGAVDKADQAKLAAVAAKLAADKLALGYKDLYLLRGELAALLRKLQVMDEAGRIVQGVQHTNRLFSHQVIDQYAALEMAICVKACRELAVDKNDRPAREALLWLLRESREYLVVDMAAKFYRRLNLDLGTPKTFSQAVRHPVRWLRELLEDLNK